MIVVVFRSKIITMVTVRGRKKSMAPRMAPPRNVPERTESEDENELLEGDSHASTDANEATFIQVSPESEIPGPSARVIEPTERPVETLNKIKTEQSNNVVSSTTVQSTVGMTVPVVPVKTVPTAAARPPLNESTGVVL